MKTFRDSRCQTFAIMQGLCDERRRAQRGLHFLNEQRGARGHLHTEADKLALICAVMECFLNENTPVFRTNMCH